MTGRMTIPRKEGFDPGTYIFQNFHLSHETSFGRVSGCEWVVGDEVLLLCYVMLGSAAIAHEMGILSRTRIQWKVLGCPVGS